MLLQLVLLVVVIVVLRNVMGTVLVKGSSMEPNFYHGDFVFINKLSTSFGTLIKGDIVICRLNDEKKNIIKRVIGLPGEKVTIEDAKIYINDSETPLKEDYLKETWTEATGPFEFEVPKDSYLVLGDNRNDSYDARYWDHTYVSKDKIIGKAYFIYYPFQRLGSLYK